jgi:flagellar biosynthesis protein FlhB
MAEDQFDKTEAPTPRKRQETRQEGNVARSTDLTAACSLLAAMVLLQLFGLRILHGLKLLLESVLEGSMISNPTRADDVTSLFHYCAAAMVTLVGPLLLCITGVALLASVAQVGFLVTGKPLQPTLSKLSPLRGVRNIIGPRAGMRLLMSLGKLLIIAAVAAVTIHSDMERILVLGELDLLPMFATACQLFYTLALRLALVLLVLGILDYAYQRWQHERDMRMSKQDIREELKRMEGDPLVKQRRARVARQLALQRIGHAVPKADVVVTNPTHFAIALRYESGTMTAPKVVAKGADFLAMRIRQIAAANGVPMVERRELAQALYRSVEVGQEVPPQFYSAVAEILAYVYRLGGRRSA